MRWEMKKMEEMGAGENKVLMLVNFILIVFYKITCLHRLESKHQQHQRKVFFLHHRHLEIQCNGESKLKIKFFQLKKPKPNDIV